jgi:FeS assembly protein IscX
MKWIDIQEIVLALDDRFPDVDPTHLRFTDLRSWILSLPGFDDDPQRCGERILEAVQQRWIEERDE